MSISVQRNSMKFTGDSKRVIARLFIPEIESRTFSIITKVRNMPEEAAKLSLHQTLRDFSGRHRNISKVFSRNFKRMEEILSGKAGDLYLLTENKKLLIGAFFTMEYSIESTALYNPSMVEDPDQTALQEGEKRVVISFRATGEGHISSMVFRGGILDADQKLHLSPVGRLIEEAEVVKNIIYKKEPFFKSHPEIDKEDPIVKSVMDRLNFEFDYNDLEQAIERTRKDNVLSMKEKKTLEKVVGLGDSHYDISFSLDTGISDRVIYPISAAESKGIEDARFVKFTNDDGRTKYYAPYTACNGVVLMPKLMETTDFYNFKVLPIHGVDIKNRGMALFPRKINGKYAMLARLDGVNNFVLYSNEINKWKDGIQIQEPRFPWEFIQVGNCGSPIETEFGWIVITHGVGTMRRYCISAMLLDLDEPTKVINQLNEPLIIPNEEEREGYVPNVVYSCGSIVHNDRLVIPYGISDTSSTYATVSLKELLSQLVPSDMKLGRKRTDKSKGRVLIVEDEVANQRMISLMLKGDGYEVEIASDGLIALMKIEKEKYDVILSDVSMPNFDGYRLLEHMKENKIKIPVIFLSGHTSQEDEAKGLLQGAADYIRKPVDRSLLLLRLEKLFKTL